MEEKKQMVSTSENRMKKKGMEKHMESNMEEKHRMEHIMELQWKHEPAVGG